MSEEGGGPVEASLPARGAWLGGLTVADGLMAAVGIVAAVARFAYLGAQPLSPGEAGAALASWQFSHGAALTVPVASPAYFTFTHLIMLLGGDGDSAARLVPALFGLATVLLPWLWRGRMRPAVWLVAGVFLAVSPLQLALSRTAGGDAIALFALLLLAVAGRRLDEGERWGAVAGAALGLGLTSSPLFYTGLLALVPAWWVFGNASGIAARTWRWLLAAAALVFVAVGTCFLLYVAGIAAAFQLLPQWLAQFGLPAAGAPDALSPLLALLRYEPALLFLGLPAAVWAILRGDGPGKQLALWVGLLLPVLVLRSAALHDAAAALAPGYLLVGLWAAELLTSDEGRASLRRTALVAGGVGLLGVVMLVAVARFTRLNLWQGGEAPLVILAVLAFVFAGVAVMLALSWDSTTARRGAFVGIALLLLFWQWGTGWHLSFLGANDARERWVVAGTDDDVPVMVELLARMSRQAVNSNTDLEVFSTVDSPVLRWYLRDFGRFQTGPALPVQTQAAVLITADSAQPQTPNDYFGADFGLEQRDLAGADSGATGGAVVAELLRWWLFHESTLPTEQQRIILWVRSDLATAQ